MPKEEMRKKKECSKCFKAVVDLARQLVQVHGIDSNKAKAMILSNIQAKKVKAEN